MLLTRCFREEEAIRWAEFRPGHHAPVHGEVLPQSEVLQDELAVAAAEEREESYQVEQRADHGQDSLWIRSEDQSLGRRTGFWRRTGWVAPGAVGWRGLGVSQSATTQLPHGRET